MHFNHHQRPANRFFKKITNKLLKVEKATVSTLRHEVKSINRLIVFQTRLKLKNMCIHRVKGKKDIFLIIEK